MSLRREISAGHQSNGVVWVGAFPSEKAGVVQGGNLTGCRILLESEFSELFDLYLIDSTQRSQPPPSLFVRARDSMRRWSELCHVIKMNNVTAFMALASGGLSFLEKGLMALYAGHRGKRTILLVRSGHFMDQCRRFPVFRHLAKMILSRIDFVPCQGWQWQQFYTSVLGLDPKQCEVIENWTATPELLEIGKRKTRPFQGHILYLGWIEEFKGVFDLVDAISLLEDCSTDYRLVLAGGGSALEPLRERIRSNGLQDKVEILGWVDPEDVRKLLEWADVLVLPSYTEGMPNSIIEAMASKLVVIASRVGSIPDVISDYDNGILVTPGHVEELAQSLQNVFEDDALRSRLADKAYETASRRFTADCAVQKLSRMICEVAVTSISPG